MLKIKQKVGYHHLEFDFRKSQPRIPLKSQCKTVKISKQALNKNNHIRESQMGHAFKRIPTQPTAKRIKNITKDSRKRFGIFTSRSETASKIAKLTEKSLSNSQADDTAC